MSIAVLRRLLLTLVVGIALAIVPAAAPAASATDCFDTSVPGTVEENRLNDPGPGGGPSIGEQILTAAGFDPVTSQFADDLCTRTAAYVDALGIVNESARKLWHLAVGRAQGSVPVAGTLPGYDDRPLYWARLRMSYLIRSFDPPGFVLSGPERAKLLEVLELASRGMSSMLFDTNRKRVFVSGFDPFLLDSEPRRSNPSGVAALTLDGKGIVVDGIAVHVQAVIFPVRYADFDDGIAEQVYTSVLSGSTAERAHLYATISQGRPGAFDLEVFNGRRRSSTAGDNLNVQGGGTRTDPLVFPNVGPGPEFTTTTLPVQAMSTATGQPYPVRINAAVVEIPAGQTEPVFRPNGPTAGSIAVSGSGGGYLSNEIAYRATRLRDALGTGVLGGHLHTPTVSYPADPAALTDAALQQGQTDIAAQVRLLLERAVPSLT